MVSAGPIYQVAASWVLPERQSGPASSGKISRRSTHMVRPAVTRPPWLLCAQGWGGRGSEGDRSRWAVKDLAWPRQYRHPGPVQKVGGGAVFRTYLGIGTHWGGDGSCDVSGHTFFSIPDTCPLAGEPVLPPERQSTHPWNRGCFMSCRDQ